MTRFLMKVGKDKPQGDKKQGFIVILYTNKALLYQKN